MTFLRVRKRVGCLNYVANILVFRRFVFQTYLGFFNVYLVSLSRGW